MNLNYIKGENMLTRLLSNTLGAVFSGIILFSSFQAECDEVVHDDPREIFLEGKASYFVSSNKRFRDIYGGAGLYRIETNVQVWDDFYAWADLGYLYGWGRSDQKDHSHLHLVPLSVGISYFFQADNWTPYAGIGPILAYSRIYNGSKYVTRRQDGWGGGLLTKLGFLAYLTDRVFLDCFADYSFIRMSFHHGKKVTTHSKGDLSGLSFGVGAGYRF